MVPGSQAATCCFYLHWALLWPPLMLKILRSTLLNVTAPIHWTSCFPCIRYCFRGADRVHSPSFFPSMVWVLDLRSCRKMRNVLWLQQRFVLAGLPSEQGEPQGYTHCNTAPLPSTLAAPNLVLQSDKGVQAISKTPLLHFIPCQLLHTSFPATGRSQL